MAIEQTSRRFSVEEYERMVAVGILTADDHVELIEGTVVEMSPIGPLQADIVRWLNRFFERILADRAIVSVQSPVKLPPRSEPEPDVALLRPGSYRERHPGPEDVLLVIEAADSSVLLDRRYKIPMYARAGIPEAWLVDLNADRVERYRTPGPSGYQSTELIGVDGRIHPDAFPDAVITLRDLFA